MEEATSTAAAAAAGGQPASGSTPPTGTASKTAPRPKQPKEPKAKAGNSNASKRPRRGEAAAEDAPGSRAETPKPPDAGVDEEGEKIRPDPTVGARVVVIHVGSANLRIGLSTSNTPLVVPHCIAWRRTPAPGEIGAKSEGDEASHRPDDQEMEGAARSLVRAARVASELLSHGDTLSAIGGGGGAHTLFISA